MQTQYVARQIQTAQPSCLPYAGIVPSGICGMDREALVLEHVSLVRFIARRMHSRVPQHVELEDMVSAGMVGLLDAADKFSLSKGVQFKSYAQIRIRGAILDSLRSEDWSSRELRRKGRAIAETIRVLSLRLSRIPTDEEIAAELGMDLDSFQKLTGNVDSLKIKSLEEEREDSGETDLDLLQAPKDQDPLALCLEAEQKEQVLRALDFLPEKERLVLQLSVMEGLTMKEIGLVLGVVESRVSQIRAAAIRQLKRAVMRGTLSGKVSRCTT